MPHLAPQTLTRAEQDTLLQASKSHPRDHLIFSLALGTGFPRRKLARLCQDGSEQSTSHYRLTEATLFPQANHLQCLNRCPRSGTGRRKKGF